MSQGAGIFGGSCSHRPTGRVTQSNSRLRGRPVRHHGLLVVHGDPEVHGRKVTCPGPHGGWVGDLALQPVCQATDLAFFYNLPL